MIQFLILLAISPVLVPMLLLASAFVGALAGLWFGAFLVIGVFQIFFRGWE